MNLDDFLRALATDDEPLEAAAEPSPTVAVSEELVIESKTGRIRQAGADARGAWIESFRKQAERSLFVFATGVLGRDYLTKTLHRPTCDWLQSRTRQRKLALLPREHCKTSIVSHALPCHLFVQPEESNVYFNGLAGAETRILLAGETEQRATDNLRVIESAFEGNAILRALWPHRCWDEPRRQAKKWNDREMILPRPREFPDPSIRAIGVGGAVTGMHPNVLIKDDLISFEAANSPTVMQTAIDWHVTSRALINDPSALEFIVGTRWAAYDLYRFIEETDSSVEILRRAAIEEGQPIYPERFTLEQLDRIRAEFGVRFPLLYLNTAIDASLTDFDMNDVRRYEVVGAALHFTDDPRDVILAERGNVKAEPRTDAPRVLRRGDPLESLTGRAEFMRLKYG